MKFLARLEGGVLLVLFAAMMLVAVYQILARNFFGTGIPWGDGFVKFAVLWVALFGAMLASRHDEHIHIDILRRLAPPRLQSVINRITAGFTCLISGLFTWLSLQFTIGEYQFPMMAFGTVPSWLCALILPFGFGIISLRYFLHTVRPPVKATH